jgi:hypothetical protein
MRRLPFDMMLSGKNEHIDRRTDLAKRHVALERAHKFIVGDLEQDRCPDPPSVAGQ